MKRSGAVHADAGLGYLVAGSVLLAGGLLWGLAEWRRPRDLTTVPAAYLCGTFVGQCDLTLYKNQCCYRATWMSCQMTFPCTNPQQLQCPKDLISLGTCGAQKTPKGQQCKSRT